MTAKEIVLGGYASYVEGDMEALGSIYHADTIRFELIPERYMLKLILFILC